MKHLFFLFLLMNSIAFSNNQKPTPTSVSNVTVYLNGAQVTRLSKITLPFGTTTLTFDKLSPYIQESSIQISGLKSTSILSINYGINYLSKQNRSETIETLQNEITALKDQVQFEDDLIAGYDEELQVIQENRKLGNDSQVVELAKLQQFSTYYRKRITEIKNLMHASLKKKREFDEQLSELQKQLNEFNVDDKVQTGEITVKLNTTQTSELDLIIKYNVDHAGWFPVYDIKADKINAPIQLTYKAHVYQNTGSDWNHAKLTLSTSDPNTNNEKPQVSPKYLNFISRHSNYISQNATKSYNYKYNPFIQNVSGIVSDASGSPLPGANVIVKGTTNGTATDFDGNYTIKTNGGKALEFSYLGFKTETFPIHSSIMNIFMNEDVERLDEVVTVGYGLAGRVSGIKIRGGGNIKNESNPLTIIDGIISTQNDFSNLDPDLIESIEVLKDSDATSLYGSRAQNGVVLVTTKKGAFPSNGNIVEEGITNQRFEIKKPYTIPSDGDITVIEIDQYAIPATYAYFAAPVVNENVFLTAKMGNWEHYNLLPGEANVYFEGSYSGKTNINPQSTTDSLTISLGVDPNVAIKRNTVNNFKKNSFIGNQKTIYKDYEIQVKNNKPSSIDLIVMDRIPVSQNKDIKVDAIETGTAAYDSKKGLLEWKINLLPHHSDTYKFSYTLKYPNYKRINL